MTNDKDLFCSRLSFFLLEHLILSSNVLLRSLSVPLLVRPLFTSFSFDQCGRKLQIDEENVNERSIPVLDLHRTFDDIVRISLGERSLSSTFVSSNAFGSFHRPEFASSSIEFERRNAQSASIDATFSADVFHSDSSEQRRSLSSAEHVLFSASTRPTKHRFQTSRTRNSRSKFLSNVQHGNEESVDEQRRFDAQRFQSDRHGQRTGFNGVVIFEQRFRTVRSVEGEQSTSFVAFEAERSGDIGHSSVRHAVARNATADRSLASPSHSYPFPIKLRLKLTIFPEIKPFSQLVQRIRSESQSKAIPHEDIFYCKRVERLTPQHLEQKQLPVTLLIYVDGAKEPKRLAKISLQSTVAHILYQLQEIAAFEYDQSMLKLRSREEYLRNEDVLCDIEYVYNCLNSLKDLEFVLVKKPTSTSSTQREKSISFEQFCLDEQKKTYYTLSSSIDVRSGTSTVRKSKYVRRRRSNPEEITFV